MYFHLPRPGGILSAKRCTAGGPDVRLKHPASVKKTTGDGNCLFCALCYIITGSVREHSVLSACHVPEK